tara:strand:+ start:1201 stop:1830 length:630 start_codon:yes stop_codon:yes gene_type:complete
MNINNLKIHNADCMEIMKDYADDYFDLAVVDPPYGIGRDGGKSGNNWKHYKQKKWDSTPPKKDYFIELERVSRNQIIWGGNYFTRNLPRSMGWIYWDKGQKLSMSDGELAYTSFNRALRSVTLNRCTIRENGGLLHPTQKPFKLYKWIYTNYAEPGQKILDTHLGSGSNAIAAHYADMGEFVGCELDKEYYTAACKRIENETAQLTLGF